MNRPFDVETDLTISRVIRAPRAAVWRAWADPASLEQWWVPHPAKCKVVEFDLRPGGAFTTHYAEPGAELGPHLDASFLDVEAEKRLVFTDTLTAGWRPSPQPFMTAIISFNDHPEGTDYVAWVMHKSKADRDTHETMGFQNGWGTVAGQLAKLVEGK